MNLAAVDKINFAGFGGKVMLIDLNLNRTMYNFDKLKMLMPMGSHKNIAIPLDAHFKWKALSFKRFDFLVCRNKHGQDLLALVKNGQHSLIISRTASAVLKNLRNRREAGSKVLRRHATTYGRDWHSAHAACKSNGWRASAVRRRRLGAD
ncbi:hypothetical protein ACFFNY_18520 [Paenibacillus hodogayensis]|uniref:Uncharacterized protein n=1 Tax=Paenibacillus hodogayensis TaxID=279208 RepID=A0ABV5VZD6_9BACL